MSELNHKSTEKDGAHRYADAAAKIFCVFAAFCLWIYVILDSSCIRMIVLVAELCTILLTIGREHELIIVIIREATRIAQSPASVGQIDR